MPEFPQPIEYDALPMAVMDYSTLAVIGRVAREALTGARLRRVVGLEGGDVIFAFDRFGDAGKKDTGLDDWLFSADAKQFRVHPWPDPVPQRSVPSHLVEVATHHLSGARVDDIQVARFERVMTMSLTRREYTGEEITYRFIAELMGKHSNLILVDSSDVILASYKPVHSYQSRVREIRAGKEYALPPRQDRIEPRAFSQSEWRDFLNSAQPGDPLDDHISKTFHGMSLGWSRMICDRVGVFAEKHVSDLTEEDGKKLRLSLAETVELVLDGIPLTGESAIELVRRVTSDFTERAEDIALDRARMELTKIIDRRRRKLRSLGEGLARDLDQASKSEDYKKKADLLIANWHMVAPGARQVSLEDWETGGAVILSLDPHLTPQLQAERWYERYRKLRRTERVARERKAVVHAEEEELTKLEERLASAASIDEMNEFREQCILHGLISPDEPDRGSGRKGQADAGRPTRIAAHRYRSNDGFLILAGMNDFSNHALRRASRPDDIWLHVRDTPGAHVYIVTRGKTVPETTLKEAAMVAVWHSKARDGSKVPVDYTRAKYLTPVPGSPQGKVRFRRERTMRVTPDEKRLEMMKLLAGREEGKDKG